MTANLGPIAGPTEFGFGSWDPPVGFSGAYLMAATTRGPRSFPPLLAVQGQQLTGDAVPTFGADFFERVHYSWLLNDLGNVVSLQTVTLSVWSAFRRAETLESFTPSNAEGITILGVPSLPATLPALTELSIVFKVETEGPPTLDASFAFDWQTSDKTVHLVGSRITAWVFAPDWSNAIVERLEWKTDVIPSYDGREQRRALRLAPRKTYEFDSFFVGSDRRRAELAIWGWGGRNWALPIWADGVDLADPVAPGATAIALDTTTRDFAADSLAILLGSPTNFEVVEIESVAPAGIVLKREINGSWPAGSRIYPARTARLSDAASIPRFTGDASGARVSFDLMEPVDWPEDAGATTYRGRPVLTRLPDWSDGLDLSLARKLAQLDGLIGARTFEDESGMPVPTQRMRWTLASRADLDAWRRLLYAIRGRQGSIWVPSWASDMIVKSTIASTGTGIDIESLDYVRLIAAQTGRRDIRIELTDGTVFYRRILSASKTDETTENLVIDAALGRTVQPGDVALVSFLTLMRFDSDSIELAFWTGDVADTAVAMRGFNHDI